jgi:AraC-like DNA-binding protein
MTKELQHVLEQLFIPPTEGFKRHLEQQAALYRIFSRIMPEDEPSAARTGTDYWVERSIEYMNTHYMDGISVQDVADYSSVHRGYLSKIFTQKVGMTPMRYLEKLRMEKARELLQTTAYTINEIGLTLSYPDPYTFTHAFSKYFGVPPGKLRKTNAGQDEP